MERVILAQGIQGLIYGIPGVSVPYQPPVPYNVNTANSASSYQNPNLNQSTAAYQSQSYGYVVPGVPNTGAGGMAYINIFVLALSIALIVAGLKTLYAARPSWS